MILSDKDILNNIKNKSLRISNFKPENIRPSSYCLSLNNEAIRFLKQEITIKLADKSTYPKSEKFIFNSDNPYVIKSGEFLLASSVEKICISNQTTGFLSNISGLARLGLNVLLSTHVASGFGEETQKRIIFEIHNLSKNDIEITPDIRICHLILVENKSPSSIGYDKSFPEKYVNNELSEYYK